MVSCSGNERERKLYLDYLGISNKAWTELNNELYKFESIYLPGIGDTLTLTRKQLLLTNFNDSAVITGEGHYLQKDARVIINEITNAFVTVRTMDDSLGVMELDQLKDNISDGSYLFTIKNQLDKVKELRSKKIKELIVDYGLEESEFKSIIAEQHYLTTGEKYMSLDYY